MLLIYTPPSPLVTINLFSLSESLFQFCCSVAQLCLTLCYRRNCSMPGFPVLHHLLDFAQTHVHWVGAAIQPSHPLSRSSLLPSIFPSISVFSNELALCIRWPKYWTSASAPVLPVNIQGWFPFGLTGLISLLLKGLSRVFSSTTIRSHQFLHTQTHTHTIFLIHSSVDGH